MRFTSRGEDDPPGTIGGVADGGPASHAATAQAATTMAAARHRRADGITARVYDAPNETGSEHP